MVEVAPLKAFEYDLNRITLGRVISPPFDVIGEKDLAALRAQDPYNVVHLTLGPGTKTVKDRFEHAHELLETWIAQGVLREAPEAIYAYECDYEWEERPRRMRGLLLRLRLDPTYRTVVPHEEIFAGPTEERIKLLRATGWDLEPIHLLYPGRTVEATLWAYLDGTGRNPDLVATHQGRTHKFWRVTDSAVIGTVEDGLRGRKVYIADGHHRYSAAVKYAEERRSREYRPPRDAAWEYKLALLTHAQDPGLLILPTHRVVKKAKRTKPESVLEAWKEDFTVHPVEVDATNPLAGLQSRIQKEAATGGPVLGAWLGRPPKAYLLFPHQKVLPETIAPGKSFTWRGLDVVFLQKLALEKGMGVPEEKWGTDVTYTRDDREAGAMVAKNKAVAVLTHAPVRVIQFRAIADGGEKMPQKSTYFQPKIISGALFHKIGKPQGPPTVRRITS